MERLERRDTLTVESVCSNAGPPRCVSRAFYWLGLTAFVLASAGLASCSQVERGHDRWRHSSWLSTFSESWNKNHNNNQEEEKTWERVDAVWSVSEAGTQMPETKNFNHLLSCCKPSPCVELGHRWSWVATATFPPLMASPRHYARLQTSSCCILQCLQPKLSSRDAFSLWFFSFF